MSINKIFLQDLKEVKKQYKENPKAFKKRIKNANALIGPTDAMEYVRKIMKEK
jgi:hypothetical protein